MFTTLEKRQPAVCVTVATEKVTASHLQSDAFDCFMKDVVEETNLYGKFHILVLNVERLCSNHFPVQTRIAISRDELETGSLRE